MSTKIILCEECEGWGKISKDEVTDYHKNEKDYWDEKCDKCNGHGRLLEITENKSVKSKSELSNTQIVVRKLNAGNILIEGRNQ